MNYRYASCANWEIEKTFETHPQILMFNINKHETSLKKIYFNIIVSNNGIDDMNDNKIVHPSDDLADDVYNNFDCHNIQKE